MSNLYCLKEFAAFTSTVCLVEQHRASRVNPPHFRRKSSGGPRLKSPDSHETRAVDSSTVPSIPSPPKALTQSGPIGLKLHARKQSSLDSPFSALNTTCISSLANHMAFGTTTTLTHATSFTTTSTTSASTVITTNALTTPKLGKFEVELVNAIPLSLIRHSPYATAGRYTRPNDRRSLPFDTWPGRIRSGQDVTSPIDFSKLIFPSQRRNVLNSVSTSASIFPRSPSIPSSPTGATQENRNSPSINSFFADFNSGPFPSNPINDQDLIRFDTPTPPKSPRFTTSPESGASEVIHDPNCPCTLSTSSSESSPVKDSELESPPKRVSNLPNSLKSMNGRKIHSEMFQISEEQPSPEQNASEFGISSSHSASELISSLADSQTAIYVHTDHDSAELLAHSSASAPLIHVHLSESVSAAAAAAGIFVASALSFLLDYYLFWLFLLLFCFFCCTFDFILLFACLFLNFRFFSLYPD